MKKLLVAILLFAASNAFALDPYVELDHYSKPTMQDYGLTMANIGVEQCFQQSLCVNGKLGTPIGANDMGKYGRYWDNGDLIANISVKYYFMK